MTNGIEKLLEKSLSGRVIGAFYKVYNTLGYGFLENVYTMALCMEFSKLGIAFQREVSVPVYYDGQVIGLYRADIVVEQRLLLEVKSCAAIGEADIRQLLNYLRATDLKVGLLLHFGPKPAFHRRVSTGRPLNPQS
jgi:GxxExxY protein